MLKIAVIGAGIAASALAICFEANADKSKQPAPAEDPNVKRESCCAQFGGRWDPSVNPGYCRGLRGTNMALSFNNCANPG